MIRPAAARDLDRLLEVEHGSFVVNRLTRASLAHMLRRAHADLLVDERDGEVLGYALVLYRKGALAARLYSLAVADAARGRGVGRGLLAAAEEAARARGRTRMRLEVAEGNRPARGLYEASGYLRLARLAGYYDDGAAAIRYERALAK